MRFTDRALACLDSKQEERRVYPVCAADLAYEYLCPVCLSSEIDPLVNVYVDDLRIFATSVCRRCLFIFRPVFPARRWFQRCWEAIATTDPQIFNPEVEQRRLERYREYRQWLMAVGYLQPDASVLDIGTGYGVGAAFFKEQGHSVSVVEPERDRAEYARNYLGLDVYGRPVEEFVCHATKTFDLIIFAQCLEHTDDPGYVLSRLATRLRPGGVIYLEVPLAWTEIDWVDGLYLAHKSNFNCANLQYLAMRCGYEVVNVRITQDKVDRHFDVGLVLKVAGWQSQPLPAFGDKPLEASAMRSLYRKNWPTAAVPLADSVIDYRVPYVEHFYCTMRLGHVKLVQPLADRPDQVVLEASR